MKFFKLISQQGKYPSWFFMLLAVIAATSMWYIVTVRDRIEAQLEVNIDYFDYPPNLVVTKGLINKATIRLRGPETLLRSIPKQRLNWPIDLSSIKKGVTIIPFTNEKLSPALRKFEVVDIQPSRLEVTADTLIERNVKVNPILESPLASTALTIENQTVSPSTVIIKGPEEDVAKISDVPVRIPLNPKNVGTPIQQVLPLDTPNFVTATPSSVTVRYTITSGRTVLSRICPLTLSGDSLHAYAITPDELNIMIEVPEALAHSANYLKKLEANVVVPPLDAGESKKARIHFRLPEGMTILGNPPTEVMVTRLKNN